MNVAKYETFTNFTILDKALLFLIKLDKTAVQSILSVCFYKIIVVVLP